LVFDMSWITDNLGLLIWALIGALIIVVLLLFVLLFRLNRLTKAHKSLMSGMQGKNLEELMEAYLGKVRSAELKVGELNALCAKLEIYAQKSLQNVSVIRFNAFENMGSDLSFAAAFLDLNGDGLVISSINSREESRVYAKPISGGNSSYHLSKEEGEALKKAMDRGRLS